METASTTTIYHNLIKSENMGIYSCIRISKFNFGDKTIFHD